MNCLNNIELQKYIDNEFDEPTIKAISKHIQQCNKCENEYKLLLADISDLKESLSILKVEKIEIPPIENFYQNENRKTKIAFLPRLLKIAAIVLFIAVSFSMARYFINQPQEFSQNELTIHSLMIDTDPNQQWHNNEMIITICNANNELVTSMLMDNKSE